MAFNATWSPGPDAVAGMQVLGTVIDQAALVIFLDPDSLAIMPPRDPAQWPRFACLLRDISTGAAELSEFLEAGSAGVTPRLYEPVGDSGGR